MKESRFTNPENGGVRCTLCPHACLVKEGKRGSCNVRVNKKGILYSENWGGICSTHFDPIEKKPLYHFFPGSIIFSVGSVGCNLHCKFCQNWEISQTSCEDFIFLRQAEPADLVATASSHTGNIGIAFTYNEPTVWYEYMTDIAVMAKQQGMKTVMVSNGYINPGPLGELIPLIDAFSIDLKAFTESFYRKITGASLAPVLETLQLIRESGKHLEITNLVIPNQNDNTEDFARMVDWIAGEMGRDTVLHISRYFPTYKMNEPATSTEILREFHTIASRKLNYVYLGNLRGPEGNHTLCPSCNKKVIEREGYTSWVTGLDRQGNCVHCHKNILPEQNLN